MIKTEYSEKEWFETEKNNITGAEPKEFCKKEINEKKNILRLKKSHFNGGNILEYI